MVNDAGIVEYTGRMGDVLQYRHRSDGDWQDNKEYRGGCDDALAIHPQLGV